jgi:hypothetical protein
MRHSKSRSLLVLVTSLGLGAFSTVACGGDDDPGQSEPRGGAAGTAGGGSGGKAGGAGSGGKSGGKAGNTSNNGGEGAEPSSGGTHNGSSGAGGDEETGGEGNPGGEGPGGAGAGGQTHEDTLGELGFDTELGRPRTPSGEELPSDYNPLRKAITTFHPRVETYVAGVLWDAGQGNPQRRDILFDDKAGTARYGRLAFNGPPTDTWTNAKYKNGVAADLDGDGLDEFFLVYYVENTARLDYVVLNPSGAPALTGTLDPAAPQPTTQIQWNNYAQPSLTKGDFDGSGRDQVAVGWFGLQLAKLGTNNQLAVTKRELATSSITPDGEAVFVAGGDLDGDKNDELAVTYSTGGIRGQGRVRIYDNTRVVRDIAMTYVDPNPDWGTRDVKQADVRIADVDGDHVGEVVFYGNTYGGALGYRWQIFVMEDLVEQPSEANPWASLHIDVAYADGEIPRGFATLDFNGDSVEDVFAFGWVYYVGGGKQIYPEPMRVSVAPAVGAHEDRSRIAVGDVDGDHKEDVLLEDHNRIFAIGLNGIDVVENKQLGTDEWLHLGVNTVENSSSGWWSPIIVTGNVDRDSAVMRYDGEHELLFTDPHVIAVVSSPPYFSGIGQDIESTQSTFGQATGSSSGSTGTVGFSVGFSVGYEADFLFGSASFSVEVESSFDYSSFESSSITKSVEYTTEGGEDMVVFTTIPFDVYYYTILESPTPSEVGTRFTLNIPRRPQTITADPAFFNAHSGENGIKIDERVLDHTLGDPHSYPTVSDMQELAALDGTFIGDLQSVGQSGTTTSAIEFEVEQGSETAMEIGVTFSWEAGSVAGPTVGGSVGFKYGHSYSMSATNSTLFQGTVGSIPEDEFADHTYSYGLMAYPKTLGNQTFFMLDYWVE